MTWTLEHADCLGPDGLAVLGDRSVDHVITDPPYEAECHTKGRRTKTGGWREAEARGEMDKVWQAAPLPFHPITNFQRTMVAGQIGRIVRRWALVFCQAEAIHAWRTALEAGGLDFIRAMVWVKPDAQPQFTGDRPGVGYETIVVAHRPGRKRWNGGGRVGVFSHNRERGSNGDGAPHPTTKPLGLMRELVEFFTDPDELVCDPFAGSGSTGVACKILGRHFVGWELDEAYAAIARRRLSGDEAKPRPEQPSLFGGAG